MSDRSIEMAIDTQVMTLDKKNAILNGVAELTQGVKTDGLDLKRKYAAKFAVIADKDGNILTEKGPFGGEMPAVVLGDSTWQFVDAIYSKLQNITGAIHVMAWRWVDGQGYVPDVSKYADPNSPEHTGYEGALNQLVRRHILEAKTAIKSSIPGVTELSFLGDEVRAQLKHARARKNPDSETDKAPNGVARDAGDKVTMYWAGFMRTQHTHADGKLDGKAIVAAIGKYFPELAPKS
jgi:hypothetical protein